MYVCLPFTFTLHSRKLTECAQVLAGIPRLSNGLIGFKSIVNWCHLGIFVNFICQDKSFFEGLLFWGSQNPKKQFLYMDILKGCQKLLQNLGVEITLDHVFRRLVENMTTLTTHYHVA